MTQICSIIWTTLSAQSPLPHPQESLGTNLQPPHGENQLPPCLASFLGGPICRYTWHQVDLRATNPWKKTHVVTDLNRRLPLTTTTIRGMILQVRSQPPPVMDPTPAAIAASTAALLAACRSLKTEVNRGWKPHFPHQKIGISWVIIWYYMIVYDILSISSFES
jgi:hypothetical protein